MKACFLSFATFLLVLTAAAQDYALHQPAYQHLAGVNAQWQLYPERAPAAEVAFISDKALIAYHLQQVVARLAAADHGHLDAVQLSARKSLLDTLAQYAAVGSFPINTLHLQRTPYFIDHCNTHCAVGYLMKASGHPALAMAISAQHNYSLIANITTAGLTSWAADHGFSLEELAWIQPTYAKDEEIINNSDLPVGRLHGTVKQKYYYEYKGVLGTIAFGDFDSVWNADGTVQASNGLAFFANGAWQCLGNELQGTVTHLHYTGLGAILVEGRFLHNGSTHSTLLLDQKRGFEYSAGANEEAWPPKIFAHASFNKLRYFAYAREPEKGSYLFAIEGKGMPHLVGFVAGTVHSLSIEAAPSSQYAAAHNLCISGRFDSLSFAVYRKGTKLSWMNSKNLVVAQLTSPIAVRMKKEPHLYLVDTAFEYSAICYDTSPHSSVVQSLIKGDTVYSIGLATDATTTQISLTKQGIPQQSYPSSIKTLKTALYKPYHINREVYFDGKRLRIKD